ncbi:MAG: helix-turn-helix domain-containing protein [Dehalococcoidia bacterium]|nr:helix-turn-helix domain-containing protein [Dehalococcoidia bacterium]
MPRNDFEPLMTVEEAAAYLRLKPKTLRNRVSAGTIPSVKAGHGRRFRRADLEAWLRNEGDTRVADPAA